MSLIWFFLRRKNTNTIIYALDIEDEMSRDIKSRPQLEEVDLLQCFVEGLIKYATEKLAIYSKTPIKMSAWVFCK